MHMYSSSSLVSIWYLNLGGDRSIGLHYVFTKILGHFRFQNTVFSILPGILPCVEASSSFSTRVDSAGKSSRPSCSAPAWLVSGDYSTFPTMLCLQGTRWSTSWFYAYSRPVRSTVVFFIPMFPQRSQSLVQACKRVGLTLHLHRQVPTYQSPGTAGSTGKESTAEDPGGPITKSSRQSSSPCTVPRHTGTYLFSKALCRSILHHLHLQAGAIFEDSPHREMHQTLTVQL